MPLVGLVNYLPGFGQIVIDSDLSLSKCVGRVGF